MSSTATQKFKDIALLSPTGLRPHEEHDHAHAESLVQAISSKGAWTTPIIVDRHTGIILDGHHRFAAANKLGLGLIPAIVVDYPDPEISVSSWRPDVDIEHSDVLRAGQSGRLLPRKTSRHAFSETLPSCCVPLHKLNGARGL
jgi:ParB-like chromosome segregation protein Spo0J